MHVIFAALVALFLSVLRCNASHTPQGRADAEYRSLQIADPPNSTHSLVELSSGQVASPDIEAADSSKLLDPSVDELERGVERARDTLGLLHRLLRANQHVALAAGGMLGLVHGGSIAYTILFIESFRKSGWPLMQSGFQRGLSAYDEAKAMQLHERSKHMALAAAPLQRDLVDLAAHLVKLRHERASKKEQEAVIRQMREVRQALDSLPVSGRAAPVIVAACAPAVVYDLILGIWTGVAVSLAAARSSAVRTVGIGVGLGEVVSKTVTAVFAKVELVTRRVLSGMPWEAVILTHLGPSLFASAAINLLSRCAGCFFAYRLQHLAAVLSVSLLSANMLLESIVPSTQTGSIAMHPEEEKQRRLRRQQRREVLIWLLAVASLLSQRSRDFALPVYLKIILQPVLFFEAVLEKQTQSAERTRQPTICFPALFGSVVAT